VPCRIDERHLSHEIETPFLNPCVNKEAKKPDLRSGLSRVLTGTITVCWRRSVPARRPGIALTKRRAVANIQETNSMRTTDTSRVVPGSLHKTSRNDGQQQETHKANTVRFQTDASCHAGDATAEERRYVSELMSTKDVAQYMKVSPRLVRDLADRWATSEGAEGLPGFRLGRKLWRFRYEDVERFCSQSAIQPRRN
jgi:hypothetical protein